MVEIGKGANRFGQLQFEEDGSDVVVSFRNVEITFEDISLEDVRSEDVFDL